MLLIPLLSLIATTTATAGTCINNDCPLGGAGLSYHGMTLINAPQVYLVRFSDSNPGLSPGGFAPGLFAADGLPGALESTVASPSYTWWMREYSTPSSPLTPGSFAGIITQDDPHLATSATISQNEILSSLQSQLSSLSINPAHAVLVVVTRADQHVTGLGSNACSTHTALLTTSSQYVPVAIIPDWSRDPGYCHTPGATSAVDNMSWLASNEVVQSTTNPNGVGGWRTTLTYEELTDICSYGARHTNPVTYKGVTNQLGLVYSAQAHACLSAPLPATLAAKFTTPGRLSVTLRVRGFSSARQRVQLAYGSLTLATATTNATGHATVHLSPLPTGTPVTLRLVPGAIAAKALVLHAPATGTTATLPVNTTVPATTTSIAP
jgi:hypothetical protein